MPTGQFAYRPKLLGDPTARLTRAAQLGEPVVAPLTAFVIALRAEAGPSKPVADFDPWDGGIYAEVLYLLEAPGPNAVLYGFISRNNPDESAKNQRRRGPSQQRWTPERDSRCGREKPLGKRERLRYHVAGLVMVPWTSGRVAGN
jgi:hypothetical protein